MMHARFTGRHMTAILVAFFGVVIAVNFLMAHYAVSTFGGVTVENSYVASQDFNRWLDEAAREKALGWSAQATQDAGGKIAVNLQGPKPGATLTAVARHPLGRQNDRMLVFTQTAPGRFVSREAIAHDRWVLRIDVRQGTQRWRTEVPLQ